MLGFPSGGRRRSGVSARLFHGQRVRLGELSERPGLCVAAHDQQPISGDRHRLRGREDDDEGGSGGDGAE